jgi:glycosyltransferase involved in cell wall biosynthesis
MEKSKILELAHFSAGTCGVWSRVKQESLELIKRGYEVQVFSSNLEKGTNRVVCSEEVISGLKIKRFPAKKLGGESFMTWNFKKAALAYSPDIIICHNYRHPHTTLALKIRDKLIKQGKNTKVFLVTHAPFIADNSTRSLLSSFVVNFYDKFIGPRTINKFDKIIIISKWEIPYLLKIGAKKEKLVYIPNSIPEEFFKLKNPVKEENKILFLGRVSPIKNLEVLIKAISLLKDKKIALEIVGPTEIEYKNKLVQLIKEKGIEKRVKFTTGIYNLKEKIKKIDSTKIFVLPSKKEGMPQSLVEALARAKIVIGSNIPGITDLVKNNHNGFIFESNNERDLAGKIGFALKTSNNQIKKNAKLSVKEFNCPSIINKLESIF